MRILTIAVLALALVAPITACAPRSDPVEQLTGVWRAKRGGLVLIDLKSEAKLIAFKNEDSRKDVLSQSL